MLEARKIHKTSLMMPPTTPDHDHEIVTLRQLIDQGLASAVPEAASGDVVTKAMRYALLTRGKRLRPLLTVAAATRCDSRIEAALPGALALEIVHTASLIVDDLPAMDNATMRRGLPTVHIAFSEDIALLATIGLLNLAYQTLLRAETLPLQTRLDMLHVLTQAVGTDGLISGQGMDLQGKVGRSDLSAVAKLNYQKTGVLFVAAFEFAALAANLPPDVRRQLREAAQHLGHSYQINDDINDLLSHSAATGKTAARDGDHKTSLSLLTLEEAKQLAEQHHQEAVAALHKTGLAACHDLTDFMLAVCRKV
jgi:geranylgeranyl diphosphate synthase, type II